MTKHFFFLQQDFFSWNKTFSYIKKICHVANKKEKILRQKKVILRQKNKKVTTSRKSLVASEIISLGIHTTSM